MNYELAKKLKDAGFPQDVDNFDGYFWSGKNKNDLIIIPSLSKLIEACGDGFLSLMVLYEKKPEKGFWAWGTNNMKVEGKTPSESVAKLWLNLNKLK